VWPFPVEWDYPKSIEGVEMTSYHKWMEIYAPASLAGLPVVTIPAGFGGKKKELRRRSNDDDDDRGYGDGDLPMGIQLLGRRFDDEKLLNIAEIYHRATDWPTRRPPPII